MKMDIIVRAIDKKQNVIITSLSGIECSRLLLKCELISLIKTSRLASFKRIYHFVECDSTVNRIYNEANSLLSYKIFGFKICKIYNNECYNENETTDSKQSIERGQLIICPISMLLNEKLKDLFNVLNSLIVFDNIPIVTIEETFINISNENLSNSLYRQSQMDNNNDLNNDQDHKLAFKSIIVDNCWSILMACNQPIEGLEFNFSCKFPIILNNHHQHHTINRNYRIFCSLVTEGPYKSRLYLGQNRCHLLINEIGVMVEEIAMNMKGFGSILILFSSLWKAKLFTNYWQQNGLFARIGLPYCCEERHSGDMKKILIELIGNNEKSIVILSHKTKYNIELTDFFLSTTAKVIISVGIPYPRPIGGTSLSWNEKNFQSETKLGEEGEGLNNSNKSIVDFNSSIKKQTNDCNCECSKSNNYKNRAIELLNRMLRRCLSDLRYQDCAIFIFDKTIEFHRSKLAHELGDIHLESFHNALERFEEFCRF